MKPADYRKRLYHRTFKSVVVAYTNYRCASIKTLLGRDSRKPCRVDFLADVDRLTSEDPKLRAQFMEACQAYRDTCEADELDHKHWAGLAGRLGKRFLQSGIANERGTGIYFQKSGAASRREAEKQAYRAMLDDVRALGAERALAPLAANPATEDSAEEAAAIRGICSERIGLRDFLQEQHEQISY